MSRKAGLHQYGWRWVAVSALLSLTACGVVSIDTSALTGSVPSVSLPEPRPSQDALLRQADEELSKKRIEPALALLNRAAKENPTSIAPWLKMSRVWFEAGNYPAAVNAANEVIERDSDNQEAKSIMVVSGLRIAAGATKGLPAQNVTSSTYPANVNVRTEADNLARALREKTLVFPVDPANADKQKPATNPKPASRPAATITVPNRITDQIKPITF